jgi:hypothetical protein
LSWSHDLARRKASRVGAAPGAFALAFFAAAASAQEWSVDRSAELYSRYSDNLALTVSSANRQSAFEIGPRARVAVSRRVEDLSVTGEAGAGARFVFGASNSDALDLLLRGRGTRIWERSQLTLGAGYRRDSTQATELDETGVVLARTQRNYFDATAGYSNLLSERWTMSLGYGFGAGGYASRAGVSGLQDHMTHSGNAGLAYQLSPTAQLLFSAGASDSRWISGNSDATTYTGGMAYSESVSERLRYSVGAGISNVRQTLKQGFLVCPGPVELCESGVLPFVPLTAEQEIESTGSTFDATGDLRLDERTSLSATALQTYRPSGIGTVVRTTSGTLSLRRAFTEKLNGGLAGGLGRAKYPRVPGVASLSESLYWNVSASLDWQMTIDWSLNAGARYASVDYTNDPLPSTSAHETSVFATVRYTWPKILLTP